MTILQETPSAQTFKFLPRLSTYDSVILIDEIQGTQTTLTTSNETTPAAGNYFYSFDAVFPIVEDRFYIIKILNGSDVVFYDRIFCTNQTATTYSINNGAYTATSTNNDFIFYE